MTTIQQKQLFDEIDILPLDLKTKLVDKLLSSINPTDDSIDDLWIEEMKSKRVMFHWLMVKKFLRKSNKDLVSDDLLFSPRSRD